MDVDSKLSQLSQLIHSADLASLSSPYLPKTFSQWRSDLFVPGSTPEFIAKLDQVYLPQFLKKVSLAYKSAILSDPAVSELPAANDSVDNLVNVLTQWSIELELAVDLIERARTYQLYEIPYGYQDLFKELKTEWRGQDSYSNQFSQFFFKHLARAALKLRTVAEDSVKGYVLQNLFQSKGSILLSVCYAYVSSTLPWPLLTLLGTQCSWIFGAVVVSQAGKKLCEKLEERSVLMKVDKLGKDLENMTADLMNRNAISLQLIGEAASGGESEQVRLSEHFNTVLNHHRVKVEEQRDFDEDRFVADNAVISEENGWYVVRPFEMESQLVEDWMIIE